MLEFVSRRGYVYVIFTNVTFGWVFKPWAISKTTWRNQYGFGVDFDFGSPFLSATLSLEKLSPGSKSTVN